MRYNHIMRLDKALASSGYGTRTEVKHLIAKGKVSVAGIVIKDPGFHISDGDIGSILIDGNEASIKDRIYLMFNKPDGVLTAMEDKRLPHVGEYLPANLKNRKISPVGRLDYHTTGLLILTNDGELSHRLTSPSYGIKKTYKVNYAGSALTGSEIDSAAKGIVLTDQDDPVKLKPSYLETEGPGEAKITLTEGKTHEVRRIFASWERPVLSLKRISIGSLTMDTDLQEGQIRELTDKEISDLRSLTGLL